MNKSPDQIFNVTVRGHEVATLKVYKLVTYTYNKGVNYVYMGHLLIGGEVPIESQTFRSAEELKAWAATLLPVQFTEW